MRRRLRDDGLRHVLAEHGRQLLDLAEGVGDTRAAVILRTQVAALDSGRRVKVRASDVGLPSDEGLVFLEVDGSVSVL